MLHCFYSQHLNAFSASLPSLTCRDAFESKPKETLVWPEMRKRQKRAGWSDPDSSSTAPTSSLNLLRLKEAEAWKENRCFLFDLRTSSSPREGWSRTCRTRFLATTTRFLSQRPLRLSRLYAQPSHRLRTAILTSISRFPFHIM